MSFLQEFFPSKNNNNDIQNPTADHWQAFRVELSLTYTILSLLTPQPSRLSTACLARPRACNAVQSHWSAGPSMAGALTRLINEAGKHISVCGLGAGSREKSLFCGPARGAPPLFFKLFFLPLFSFWFLLVNVLPHRGHVPSREFKDEEILFSKSVLLFH